MPRGRGIAAYWMLKSNVLLMLETPEGALARRVTYAE